MVSRVHSLLSLFEDTAATRLRVSPLSAYLYLFRSAYWDVFRSSSRILAAWRLPFASASEPCYVEGHCAAFCCAALVQPQAGLHPGHLIVSSFERLHVPSA